MGAGAEHIRFVLQGREAPSGRRSLRVRATASGVGVPSRAAPTEIVLPKDSSFIGAERDSHMATRPRDTSQVRRPSTSYWRVHMHVHGREQRPVAVSVTTFSSFSSLTS